MEMRRLGLMTTDLPQEGTDETLTGQTWRALAEEGAAAEVEVVLFSPFAVELGTRPHVSGRMWSSEKGWRPVAVPVPSVVVDNVFVHLAKKDRAYALNKQRLRRAGVTFLNPRFTDKAGVMRALAQRADLQPHLPETVLLRQAREVEEWLARAEHIFLKPVRGSGGHGVLCISRADQGHFFISGAKKRRKVTRRGLLQAVQEAMRGSRHLLQKGVSLLEVEGRKVDLRVVLHRDGDGVWQPIATVPRLARKGREVTNLAQGGEVRTYEWLEQEATGMGVVVPSRAETERVALLAAEAVTAVRPKLAFLGIDIGVAADGRLYVLDINPRPGRKVLSLEDRRRAFRCLVGFAKRLMKGG